MFGESFFYAACFGSTSAGHCKSDFVVDLLAFAHTSILTY